MHKVSKFGTYRAGPTKLPLFFDNSTESGPDGKATGLLVVLAKPRFSQEANGFNSRRLTNLFCFSFNNLQNTAKNCMHFACSFSRAPPNLTEFSIALKFLNH
jgi:hypothetical protein